MGIIVAIDEFAGRRAFTVDDSSGSCIEVIYTIPIGGNATAQNSSISHDKGSLADGKAKVQGPAAGAAVDPYEHLDVGAVIDVKGSISMFREEIQIKPDKIVQLKSTTQEVALWEKRAKFRKEVLGQPWILSDKEIRRCRKAAERSSRDPIGRKKDQNTTDVDTQKKPPRVMAISTLAKEERKPKGPLPESSRRRASPPSMERAAVTRVATAERDDTRTQSPPKGKDRVPMKLSTLGAFHAPITKEPSVDSRADKTRSSRPSERPSATTESQPKPKPSRPVQRLSTLGSELRLGKPTEPTSLSRTTQDVTSTASSQRRPRMKLSTLGNSVPVFPGKPSDCAEKPRKARMSVSTLGDAG